MVSTSSIPRQAQTQISAATLPPKEPGRAFREGPWRVEIRGIMRRWCEYKPGGLSVVDVPLAFVAKLGGRRQMSVMGTSNGAAFAGSTMLVAGGGFCAGASMARR